MNISPHAATGGKPPHFISHGVFREPGWRALHPLAIARQACVLDMCEALGWLPGDQLAAGRLASVDELVRFHDPAYVAAFKKADERGCVDRSDRERYGFGTMENPIFKDVFARASATVGTSIAAAELALEGRTVFHPAGGTHHGQPARASGFCYFNDPVFAIDAFVRAGATPVFYLDLDAHHGDGVQDAYAGGEDVYLVSIHEQRRWPYSGLSHDRAGGCAWNVPVPRGFNDSELAYVMEEAVLPVAERVAPKSMVITAGADALADDPLSGLAISNAALWRAVDQALDLTPRAVVLGGGGYNPWTVVRAWTGLWGRIAGFAFPETLPAAARAILEPLESDLVDDEDVKAHWLTSLTDPPNEGVVRREVRDAAAAIV